MPDAKNNLQFLDLSHNQLDTIDEVLLMYPNLSVLYLHGNRIVNSSQFRKLAYLTKLQKLTLHGNSVTTAATTSSASAPSGAGGASSGSSGSGSSGSGGGGAGGAVTITGRSVRRLEDISFYRSQVIYHLRSTQLKSLDFIPVTPRDRRTALLWASSRMPKPKKPPSDDDAATIAAAGAGAMRR